MKRWMILSCPPILLVFVVLSFGFKPSEAKVPETLRVTKPTEVLFPKNKTIVQMALVTPPFLGTSYVGFKEALAFKESRGDYFTTNTLGYLGKYQFGIGTLQLVGVYNASLFLKDPILQEKAFHTNIARNKWVLRKYIAYFEGKEIGNIQITESGILAAAHLAGPGNVKKYLSSNGAIDVMDAYGSNIAYYMKKFAGYDVSHVTPKRNPKV